MVSPIQINQEKYILYLNLEIRKGVTILRLMSEKKSEALQHTTAKLHPQIFKEIDKRVKEKEYSSFNSALNKLLLKSLGIKLEKEKK